MTSKLMVQATNLLQKGFKGMIPKYVFRTLDATGTEIRFLYEGNALKKIVTQANGNKVVSTFTKDGKTLLGTLQTTPRGKIEHTFGGQNYDKVVHAQVNDGTIFNFLGHQGRNNGILYSNASGRYLADNSYIPQYQTALDYIRGLASNTQYQVSKVSAQW